MLKNPYINAVCASLYIVVVVSVLQFLGTIVNDDKSFLIPIAMLSLLTLSVSLMGLLFFYTPVRILLEGNKDEALSFFLKTIGTFACFIIIFGILIIFKG